MRRLTSAVFWLGVVFALAHAWGMAVLFLLSWVVLWGGRQFVRGRHR